MAHVSKRGLMLLPAALVIVVIALAQNQHKTFTLAIQGYAEELQVVQTQGHLFVDAEDLARVTNGSLRFEVNRVVLVLPCCGASALAEDKNDKSHFSRQFMKAAIEAMASVREWGGA